MPAPFRRLTLEEFTAVLDRFPFTRRINSVHMHHTWRPNHAQYRGHESIVAMWRFHTEHNGWSDIAQHITIAPDGSIWTGRDWNRAPASAAGHNGNSRAGPFMFELIGDFDVGRDDWGGEQKRVALEVIASVQKKFDLPPESLRFHNQMGPKTCPGSAIDYPQTVEEVRALHGEEREWPKPLVAKEPVRFPGVILESRLPFETAVQRAVDALQGGGARESLAPPEEADAEPGETSMSLDEIALHIGQENAILPSPRAQRASDRDRFTAPVRAGMRPHVINLDRGRFSSQGLYATSPQDVDALFAEELESAAREAERAGEKLRVMFYAHGGLVAESDGLWMAHLAAPWWRQNHIYPVYFVWETGLLPQLRQVLFGPGPVTRPRGVIEETWDNAVEAAARAMRLPMDIWSNMKRSAAAGTLAGGGALRVAELLSDFCEQHADEVELHAVGHSAGSIFHSYFLPKALELGVPPFRSVTFLAPAIRVDAFHARLAPHLGKGIERMTIYTMSKDWELEDSCMGIYRKSLLYLIRNALEPQEEDELSNPIGRPTEGIPILGLEESLREDAELRRIFGLGGTRSEHGEIVWSVSVATDGVRASQSRTHGGFDNDPATMLGVAARVLGRDDTEGLEPLPQAMIEAKSRSLGDAAEIDLLPGAAFFVQALTPVAEELPFATPGTLPFPEPITLPERIGPSVGSRRALCVGINQYVGSPLNGCVADARTWGKALTDLGFEVDYLTDAEATRRGILTRLRELISASRPGDVIVFQYAGHGTALADLDGDEPDGKDEALCPVDYESGAYIIDDDLAEVWDLIPAGVNVTCFMDCCHSGTINRVVGGTPYPSDGGSRRPRYIAATPEMQAAHAEFRRRERSPGRRSAGRNVMREVSFSACLAREVAWENEGQGDFTRRAARLLASSAGQRWTNEEFHRRVVDAFGPDRVQTPELNCADRLRSALLLMP